MTFETLVIILLSAVIVLQLLNTTAMTVFIYLGWRHDQNLDKHGIHLGKGINILCNAIEDFKHETLIEVGRKIKTLGVELTEEIRSIRDTDAGK